MTAFTYRDGALHADDVPLDRIAAAHGTPCWVYSASALERRWQEFTAAFAGVDALVCYALKANSNQAVIRTLARLGAGADIVSAGELARARAAGVPAAKIVFAGVGKTEAEMAAALDEGVLQFNVESEPELRSLSRVAVAKGTVAPVALRVNPDVDAQTHAKITTGKSENKFGIEIDRARDVARIARGLPGISLDAVAVHIGSQLTAVDPFRTAFGRLIELVGTLAADGIRLKRLDLGGGLGVAYNPQLNQQPDLAAYADAVRAAAKATGLPVVLEPGRWMVADAGILLARVIRVKDGLARRFVIVDAAMSELIRPTLYEAFHAVLPVIKHGHVPHGTFDVVGPICESGDVLALARELPVLAEGELVALRHAGAYGAVMSSTYNGRPLAPEIMVRGADVAVVRARQTVEELIALDRLPSWLDEAAR